MSLPLTPTETGANVPVDGSAEQASAGEASVNSELDVPAGQAHSSRRVGRR